ncbi:MAG: AraC family transcriptional regulator [Treponema sp.]|jgi:AraC-like DNA-binding protein|nr:AraC family transcriptional regulator [Treponema sp.]
MKKRIMAEDNFFAYFDEPRDVAAPLYVTTIGKVSVGPGETYPYQREDHPENHSFSTWEPGRVLDEFQFLYITGGGGRLRSFEGEFVLRPGSLAVLVPGEKHRYAPDPETGWTEYWIGFTGDIPVRWIEQGALEKTIMVHPIRNQREMLVPFEEALGFARNGNYALEPLTASCVMRIFAYILEDRYARLTRNSYDIIEQAKSIFEKNVYHPIDMEGLTKMLGISYQLFLDQFREKTRLTPYQYFLQLKINKAKELLREGTLSIKEISYKLSFNSPYYFSRLFKRKTGVSPSQWSNTTSPKDLDLWEQ